MTQKETIQLLIEEAFKRGNLNVLKNIIHPDYRYQSPTESMRGLDDLMGFIVALRAAFPDLQIKIDDQIEEDESVVTKLTMNGTQKGEFLDLPATGKAVQLQGVVISRFEEGLIKEEWELLDQLALLQQLGVVQS
ncbi:ester cyclase [Puniceicoccaceae bacterium K14]|nr:ester cyclase [Puniceicoccaceae bacterium K14]